MSSTPAPSEHQTIISELEAAQGRQSQIGLEVEDPQILKVPLENAPSLSDNDEDDVDVLGEEEYETLLSARQAKQWADSLNVLHIPNPNH